MFKNRDFKGAFQILLRHDLHCHDKKLAITFTQHQNYLIKSWITKETTWLLNRIIDTKEHIIARSSDF